MAILRLGILLLGALLHAVVVFRLGLRPLVRHILVRQLLETVGSDASLVHVLLLSPRILRLNILQDMGQATFVSIQVGQQRQHRQRKKQKCEQRAASGEQRKKKQLGERDATSGQCQTRRVRSLGTPVSDSLEFKADSIIKTVGLCHKTGGGQDRPECNRHKTNTIGETFYRLEASTGDKTYTGNEAFRVSQSDSRQTTGNRTRDTKLLNKQPTDKVRL